MPLELWAFTDLISLICFKQLVSLKLIDRQITYNYFTHSPPQPSWHTEAIGAHLRIARLIP